MFESKYGRIKVEDASEKGLLGSTGISTLINLITQASTTVCANGQCITVYSNAIAGNLAAFGVTVADVNFVILPLILALLGYSLYTIFHS